MRRMYSLKQLEEVSKKVSKEVIESGEVDNAKPIYCHPVFLNSNRTFDNVVLQVTMLIFNNDPTPFTKSTWIEWVQALFRTYPTAKILTSGFYNVYPTSCFRVNEETDPNVNTSIDISLAETSTSGIQRHIAFADILNEATIFEDGVNKIN